MPGLSREVENAEREKTAALDAFALKADKQTESSLRIARTACEQAAKQRAETNELAAATERALKKMESEFVRPNNANELAKRRMWETISSECEKKITDSVKDTVRTLVAIGCQIGRPRQFVLDACFPNPSSGDVQTIQK